MGIWGRLGNILKSYINDGVDSLHHESPFRTSRSADDDYNAAYEELEDFLRGEKPDKDSDETRTESETRKKPAARPVPPELKADFQELGLDPRASEKECKEAYKKLLKIHHPDRFAKDPEKMKKATEKTLRINMAYERLEKWYKETASLASS